MRGRRRARRPTPRAARCCTSSSARARSRCSANSPPDEIADYLSGPPDRQRDQSRARMGDPQPVPARRGDARRCRRALRSLRRRDAGDRHRRHDGPARRGGARPVAHRAAGRDPALTRPGANGTPTSFHAGAWPRYTGAPAAVAPDVIRCDSARPNKKADLGGSEFRHSGHRRVGRADGRVQPGARRCARPLSARLRRRHVEHGDRRGAAPGGARVRRLCDPCRRRRVRADASRVVAARRRGHAWSRLRSRGAHGRVFRHPRRARARVRLPARGLRRVADASRNAAARDHSRRAHSACLRYHPGDQRIGVRCDIRCDRGGGSGRRPRFLRSQSPPEALAARPRARGHHGDDRAVRLVPAEL